MSISIKAFLENANGKPEIRRFPIDHNVKKSYNAFVEKLTSVFPAVRHKHIVTYWKDEEGDEIIVSSDEELKYMFEVSKGEIFKVYIRVVPSIDTDGDINEPRDIHPNVVCDGCNGDIRGFRYKCLQCPDYDLCTTCENKGTHNGHNMLKIVSPSHGSFLHGHPRWWRHGRGHHGCGKRSERHSHHQRRKSKDDCEGNDDSPREYQPGYLFEKFVSALSGVRMQSDTEMDTEAQNRETAGLAGGQDFLRNIGETVAAILDPLGIDVTVDVEHRGNQERCGEPRKTNAEAKEPADKAGSSSNGNGVDTETGMTKEATQTKETTVADNSKLEQQKKQVEKLIMDSHSMDVDDWTYIASNEHVIEKIDNFANKTVKPVNSDDQLEQNVPTSPLHSNPKICKALEQMLMMGFNNEGGWLTHLLEVKDGDIEKVLDVLQPVKLKN